MRAFLATALVALSIMIADPAFAAGADLPDGAIRFKVVRDGDEIGSHVLSVSHQGGDLVIDIEVRIAVKIAFVTVYRYEQTRREVWRDGRLVEFESATNDDGKKAAVKGRSTGDSLAVEGPKGTVNVAADIIPNSYWNSETVRRTALLSTFDGSLLDIMVTDMGEETVNTAAGPVPARRYKLTGDLERELWYDGTGRWVHMRTTRDDTPVDWILQ